MRWLVLVAALGLGCTRAEGATEEPPPASNVTGQSKVAPATAVCQGSRQIQWTTAGLWNSPCSWHTQTGTLESHAEVYIVYVYACDLDLYAYVELPGGGSGYIRAGAVSGCDTDSP